MDSLRNVPRPAWRHIVTLAAGLTASIAGVSTAPGQSLPASAGPAPVAAAVTDDLMALCMARGIDDRETCACAGERLVGTIGAEAVRLYGRVGREFVGDMAKGMDMGLSWDAAIDLVSHDEGIARLALLERMNRAGRDHRIAIRHCRGDG